MKRTVNQREVEIDLDPRTSLLDLLRDHLGLTGSKKGCNQGACTVLADGERILGCLALAVQCEGRSITTIEGLSHGDTLHPPAAGRAAPAARRSARSRRAGSAASTALPPRPRPASCW